MSESSSPRGVVLPEGESASTLLWRLLTEAQRAFLDILGPTSLPAESRDLKRRLSTVLLHFEQRRAEAPEAVAIAQHLARSSRQALQVVDGRGERRPLSELPMAEPFEIVDPGPPRPGTGWRPSLPLDGETIEGRALSRVVDLLEARRHLSLAMAAALRRALSRLDGEGRLDLSGERFALLGAGAEIAPTRHLLEAGATVLWCDRVPPPRELVAAPGRLLHAGGACDLLAAPDRVAGTVARFVEAEGPVHLGLFAYGPGKGREWRLAAAMNALARRLPEPAVRSVGLYVSPTSPVRLGPEEARARDERLAGAPRWQRSAGAVGMLARCRDRAEGPPVADVVVPLQGVSYQAAQWLEKRIAMAALAADRPGLRVSANVAPITQTRSLEHPVFRVAFRGAPAFGVCAYSPAFTRTLAGLAYVDDILGTEGSFDPKHLHGGVFALPYTLESAIRVAAVRGLAGSARLRA